jgi:hypothetical protein
MSQAQFVVTADWRLGNGIVGLSDSPEWLSRAAASAVRRSVQNVVDVAAANECQFILVAGRIASRENFPVAAAWLRERAGVLNGRGIRLLVAGHDADEIPQLAPLKVVALKSGGGCWVTTDGGAAEFSSHRSAGAWRLQLGAIARGDDTGLCCSVTGVSDAQGMPAAGLRPSVQPGSGLSVGAVSPQRLSADESGIAGGCVLVTVNASTGQLRAEQRLSEVLEFHSIEEYCETGTTIPQLLKRLAERSRSLLRGCGVQLVDWRIDGVLRVSLWDDGAFRERDLLQALRGLLNAGHGGAWPYRLRFAEGFRVELCAGSSHLLAGITGLARQGMGAGSEFPELLHQLQRAA